MKNRRPRTILLREGEVTFERQAYECARCRATHAPLDRELGVEAKEHLSRGVRELACWHAAQSSMEAAVRTLQHCHGLTVSSSQIERLVRREGARILEAQEEREESWRASITEESPVLAPEIRSETLVVEVDGTIVLTRPGEENKTVWVARAFDAGGRGKKETNGRPFIAGPSRYAAGAGALEDFEHQILSLANRMGARGASQIVAVADGAEPLWNALSRRLPGAVQIQDYWHVCERLCGLARDLCGEASEAARSAMTRWKSLLWEGQMEELLADLHERRKQRRGAKRARIEEEISYLKKGRHRMDYPRYRAEGWLVGSGAVEAACKKVVKERFARTGARWGRSKIKDMLALRIALANEQWDDHWQHKAA